MKLGIYGAGGLGREALLLAQCINDVNKRWDEIFFIDDINYDRILNGHRVFSSTTIPHDISFTAEIVIAVGEPILREKFKNNISHLSIPLATLIHPSVFVPENTVIKEGCIINEGVFLSCDVYIGANVCIQQMSRISHDCSIHENTVLASGVCLAGGCNVGKRVFIGMGVMVRERRKIGDFSVIGMGSVVVSDLPDKIIAFGSPARVVKENDVSIFDS
ncbi:acetyltransferase [Dickeya lacustris]|uniref:Acetyltransferase n=1 Tax=Dickeya lacustris TaxID=2259638 RepID=A0ABY8G6M1_9GAMM|nr:acetyltransferase [Dickeya lacustris]WFN55570.1 acetyltransferase [Dickeya lacustris]